MKSVHVTRVDKISACSPFERLEDELLKDRWEASNIPGLRYAPHTGNNYVSFLTVPERFRPFVKEYIRFLLDADLAAGTLDRCTHHLGDFFLFFVQQYPDLHSLQPLVKGDIDRFILKLRADGQTRGVKLLERYVWEHISALEGLLSYLERIESPIRPSEPTTRIIWPHHFPKNAHTKPRQMKYIPQMVLDQLDTHLQKLSSSYIPIVIILRASGWRISDVLYLKVNTCLEQDGEKHWLVGDIQKTRVLGHRIPITAEVAVIVRAQMEWVKKHYTASENPKGWLFPASKTRGMGNSKRFWKGDPLQSGAINQALNGLAKKCQILDEQNTLFHFKSHAFRHTKAVELINNGMSLILVQQWMAHASPEMTLIYAKILDETMRTQWEKTVQQGIVQFNHGSPAFVPGKKLLPVAGANTFDPERVREHRQNIKMALGSCLKTAKMTCKFVELPCFHCPAYVLTPNDLPALEVYEQQILERIEVGKQAGNAHWCEVNQRNLDERVRPAIALLKQGQMLTKTEKQEREYTDEEWDQRHAHKREERGSE